MSISYPTHFECPLSLTSMRMPVWLNCCTYRFDLFSLLKQHVAPAIWEERKPSCPMCRREITVISVDESLLEEINRYRKKRRSHPKVNLMESIFLALPKKVENFVSKERKFFVEQMECSIGIWRKLSVKRMKEIKEELQVLGIPLNTESGTERRSFSQYKKPAVYLLSIGGTMLVMLFIRHFWVEPRPLPRKVFLPL